jgi:mono/diheme cytochrome c family protein
MKKIFLLALTISTITILCSFVLQQKPWDVPAEFKTKKNPIAKTEKALAEGKAKYNQVCAGCHGLSGKGDGEKIKKLANIKPVSLTDERIVKESDGEHFYKIKYGRNQNHSFAGKIDDETIWEIVHYTRTFAQK